MQMKTKQHRPGTAPASLTHSRSAESSSLSEFRRRLSDHSALSVEKLSLARPLSASPVPTLNSTRGFTTTTGTLERDLDGATVLTALSTLGSGTVGGGAPFTLGSARL